MYSKEFTTPYNKEFTNENKQNKQNKQDKDIQLEKKDKKDKLVLITLIYLFIGNIVVPILGYLYTGTIKGALKIYGASYIISFIFWPYFGYLLLDPVELIKNLFKNN